MLMPLSMAPLGGAGQPDSAGFGAMGQGQRRTCWPPLIITLAVLVAILVWYVVVSVKAVKTVNGFGTAKAFGLLVVANVGYGAALLAALHVMLGLQVPAACRLHARVLRGANIIRW